MEKRRILCVGRRTAEVAASFRSCFNAVLKSVVRLLLTIWLFLHSPAPVLVGLSNINKRRITSIMMTVKALDQASQ